MSGDSEEKALRVINYLVFPIKLCHQRVVTEFAALKSCQGINLFPIKWRHQRVVTPYVLSLQLK